MGGLIALAIKLPPWGGGQLGLGPPQYPPLGVVAGWRSRI
jgi:hypothetical protein